MVKKTEKPAPTIEAETKAKKISSSTEKGVKSATVKAKKESSVKETAVKEEKPKAKTISKTKAETEAPISASGTKTPATADPVKKASAKKTKPMAEKKVSAEEESTKKSTNTKEVDAEVAEAQTIEATKEVKQTTEKSKEAPKPASQEASLENFDWDSFESDETEQTPQMKEYELMYDETLSTIAVDEVIDGKIISMNSREVVINIGYKSEGIVSLNEFRYNPDLKPDDTVEVYVESQEDKRGQLILSHKRARTIKSWARINTAFDSDEIINGFIKCRTKGGMIVDIFGIEAFLPGSQIDVKPIRDYDVYVGNTMEFKVVKINPEFKNVVVSHKALIEAELEHQKKEIIAKLEKGQVLEGTVKNITSYGIFIDLGGIDGLIHITDLSWGRVNHPDEVVELDQKLNVVILDFDDDKKRIALGLKQLTPHPWDSLDENLKVGDKVKGKVVVMADYGAFVEINAGVEGLIHVSEMSWSQHLRSAQEFMEANAEIDAIVLTLDREQRKMSLGIKQLKPDPWENIENKFSEGSVHSAKVRNFTSFGVFVEIEEGVDGLIHVSDLSWTKKIKHPAEFTSIDAQIEVVVLEIDKENRRLSLGHKQLEENPWDVFESLFEVDTIHDGTIIDIFGKGAVVALQYGVEGFVTPKHLLKEDGTMAKLDDKLKFKVIEFNKSAKKIILSHSIIAEDIKLGVDNVAKKAGAKTTKITSGTNKAKMEKTTLGDITDLAALKTEMEESESKITKSKKK